jgi:hypothetical protein
MQQRKVNFLRKIQFRNKPVRPILQKPIFKTLNNRLLNALN